MQIIGFWKKPSLIGVLATLMLIGILAGALIPEGCSASCKVARFANSSAVSDILRRGQASGSLEVSPQTLPKPKADLNSRPPTVEAYMTDALGNALIVAERGSVVIAVQRQSDRLTCRVIYPDVDSKWCNLPPIVAGKQ